MPLSTSAYQSCTGSQCSRRFSQGKPVAPFASPCRDQRACSAFSALFGKLERFSHSSRRAGQKEKLMHYQHVVPGAVPTGVAIDVWKCSIKVFLAFWVFGLVFLV